MTRSVCVFCGSSKGNSPVYEASAVKLAEALSNHSLDLVYGGSNIGLMGIVASTMLKLGRKAIGVIPTTLYEAVEQLAGIELIVVDTMHERKAAMYERADAFIALPGGIGTFEELLEVYTWVQLGYLNKPVSLLNINGYYDHLIAQLQHSTESGFMKQHHLDSLIIEQDPELLIERLNSATYTYTPKWQ